MIDIPQREEGFVYGIQSLDLIKIGLAKNIAKRLETCRLYNPHGCELVFYRKTFAPFTFERTMHALLQDRAVGREWFRASLTDVREAAKVAASNAMKAKRTWEKWRRENPELAHREHTDRQIIDRTLMEMKN